MSILAVFHIASLIVLMLFVPMILHGVYGTVKLSPGVHFERLGFLLFGPSILFVTPLCYVS